MPLIGGIFSASVEGHSDEALATLVTATLFAAASAHAAVVVPETEARPAVVPVTGRFFAEDGGAFIAKVAGLKNATVYFVSPDGSAKSGISIGLIIRRREFGTAVSRLGLRTRVARRNKAFRRASRPRRLSLDA